MMNLFHHIWVVFSPSLSICKDSSRNLSGREGWYFNRSTRWYFGALWLSTDFSFYKKILFLYYWWGLYSLLLGRAVPNPFWFCISWPLTTCFGILLSLGISLSLSLVFTTISYLILNYSVQPFLHVSSHTSAIQGFMSKPRYFSNLFKSCLANK